MKACCLIRTRTRAPLARPAHAGPYKQFGYKALSYNEVVVIAGGTGITPSFQLIKQIVENPEDTTHVVLIFANHGASVKLGNWDTAVRVRRTCLSVCSRILVMISSFLEPCIGGIRLSPDCHQTR